MRTREPFLDSTKRAIGFFPRECRDIVRQYVRDYEAEEMEIACALYWCAADYHSGQTSSLYRALSALEYKPGALETEPEDGSIAALLYDELAEALEERETAARQRATSRRRAREYPRNVENGLKGLEAVSVGLSPGCLECASAFLERAEDEEGNEEERSSYLERWRAALDAGAHCDEGSFSWGDCGICGTSLGGNRYYWHALDKEGRALHFDDCCTDCVQYLANGTLPNEEG